MFEAVSKQDKQAARTAADLERRYGAKFSEVMGIAEEAREAAEEAKVVVEGLDQDAIFNLLTRNGEVQGMFMDENGQIYINASYLAAGIIASVNGSVKLDLTSNELEITIPPAQSYYVTRKMVFNDRGIGGFSEGSYNDGRMFQTLQIIPGIYPEDQWTEHKFSQWTRILALDSDLLIAATSGDTAWRKPATRIGVDENSKIVINNKVVSWKPNSDGTYTLIGTDE